MPQDRPTLDELLEAVTEFLEREAMPGLEGRVAFHARVAINVLGIVRRELASGDELATQEHTRLLALLDQKGTLDELNRELSARIADGRMGLESRELIEHLQDTVRGKVSIDNPRYATYRETKDG